MTLLFWVFIESKRDIHHAMMDAAEDHTGAAHHLRVMWMALVDNGLANPAEFLFVEMMSAEMRNAPLDDPELARMRHEVLDEVQAGIDQRILVDAPVGILETVLASPAMTLAPRASFGGVPVTKDELGRLSA